MSLVWFASHSKHILSRQHWQTIKVWVKVSDQHCADCRHCRNTLLNAPVSSCFRAQALCRLPPEALLRHSTPGSPISEVVNGAISWTSVRGIIFLCRFDLQPTKPTFEIMSTELMVPELKSANSKKTKKPWTGYLQAVRNWIETEYTSPKPDHYKNGLLNTYFCNLHYSQPWLVPLPLLLLNFTCLTEL